MKESELKQIINIILNVANDSEFQVILKAVERRQKDRSRYAGLGGLNPGNLAQKMAESVQAGLDSSVEGLKNSVREYVARIVRQKEPGISDEEIEAIVEYCLPDRNKQNNDNVDGSVPDIPSDALATMVKEFYEYSLGSMLPSKQKELWDAMPDWQNIYWKSFPPQIRSFLKARLDDRISDDEFWSAVLGFLGL